MTNMHGNATITVTGHPDLLEAADKIIHDFKINEDVALALKQLVERWGQAMTHATQDSEDAEDKTVELESAFDIMAVGLMPFEKVAEEIPAIAIVIQGDFTDPESDEKEKFFVRHEAGGCGWEVDDWIFNAVRI